MAEPDCKPVPWLIFFRGFQEPVGKGLHPEIQHGSYFIASAASAGAAPHSVPPFIASIVFLRPSLNGVNENSGKTFSSAVFSNPWSAFSFVLLLDSTFISELVSFDSSSIISAKV